MADEEKQEIRLELTAPEKRKVSLTGLELVLPGAGGVFTVMSGHTPLLTTLTPGVLAMHGEGEDVQYFAVSGGFAEVKDDVVSVLAPTFEAGQEIDVERAEAARERAETRLAKPPEDLNVRRAEMALARSLARLSAQRRDLF